MPFFAKTVLRSILLGASVSSGALHAAYFADVSLYDDNNGEYLGVVENGSANVPYAERVTLNILPTVDFDWIRMTPNNSECGRNRQYERAEPIEMVITPGSIDSQCQLTLEAMKSPGVVADSMVVYLTFNDDDNANNGGGNSGGSNNGGSNGGNSAASIGDIAIYNKNNGNYLGTVANGSASVNYASNLRLRIAPSVDYDWLRFIPNNEDCGRQRQYENGNPVEMSLAPNSVNSECQFTLDAMKSPGVVNATMDVSIDFSGGNSGTDPDPDPDPTPDPDPGNDNNGGKRFTNNGERIEFTQGTFNSKPYNVGSVVGRSAHGNRIFCVVSHFSYDDPIIYPGLPGAAHLHMFWGNSGTDAYSTPESLPYSGASSCEGGTNYRAGLWIPALFNSSDEVVVPENAFIYYKKFGSKTLNFNHLQVVPQGLEMLASKTTRNFTDRLFKVERMIKDGKPALRMDLSFPSCVATHDGTRTGNPILSYKDMPGAASEVVNSHVSYPGGPNRNSVDCPASHPYGFPTPSAIIVFDAAAAGANPYLSSDAMSNAPNMSTLHADYVFGMDDQVSQQMLKCTQEARDCRFETSGGNLSERFYDSEGNQVYQYNNLAPGYDRTPFGKSLSPMDM